MHARRRRAFRSPARDCRLAVAPEPRRRRARRLLSLVMLRSRGVRSAGLGKSRPTTNVSTRPRGVARNNRILCLPDEQRTYQENRRDLAKAPASADVAHAAPDPEALAISTWRRMPIVQRHTASATATSHASHNKFAHTSHAGRRHGGPIRAVRAGSAVGNRNSCTLYYIQRRRSALRCLARTSRASHANLFGVLLREHSPR